MTTLKLSIERRSWKLPRPAWNALSSWSEREGLLLRIEDGEGRTGIGEASPLPGYSPDSVDRCEETLRAAAASPPPGIRLGEEIAPQLEKASRSIDPDAPAAKFALESALLDLAGKRAGLPASLLLSGYAARETVPLAALIQSTDVDGCVAEAKSAAARGIRTIKMKIGSPGAFDAERRLILRLKKIPGVLAIRLDANGAWSMEEVSGRLRSFAEAAPEFVEQPVGEEDLFALEESPVPLAADESLLLAGDPPTFPRVCRVLVLKPALLGGFAACLRVAEAGTARGLDIVVGHVFDGPVALAACAELALSLSPPPLACGLDRHAGLDAWPDVCVSQVNSNSVRRSGLPGLGLEYNKGATP